MPRKYMSYEDGGKTPAKKRVQSADAKTKIPEANKEDALRMSNEFPEFNSDEYLTIGKVKKYRSSINPDVPQQEGIDRLREISQARSYMTNWVKNRKSADPIIAKELELVKSDKLKNIDLVDASIMQSSSDKMGKYDNNYKEVVLYNENLKNPINKGVAVHEMSHAADIGGRKLTKGENNLIQSSVNPTKKFQDDNALTGVKTSYYTEPTEVKARLSVLRKEMQVRPDETVTLEKLKTGLKKYGNLKNVEELKNTVPDENKLLDLMNKLGSVKTKNKLPAAKKMYAELGGFLSPGKKDLPQLILGGDPSIVANAKKMAGVAGAASAGAGAAGATPVGAIVQGAQMVGEAVGGAVLSANTDDDGLYKNNAGTSAGLAIKGLTNPMALIGNIAGGLSKIGEEPAHKVLGRMVGLGAKYDAQEQREKLNKGRSEKMLAEGSQKFLGSNRFGNDVTEMYRNGGTLMPEYNAEDGEIVVGKPKVFRGGKVKKMGGNLYEVDGKSHEQGGVDMAGGKFILSDADKLKVNGMTPADMVREGADVSQVATMQETMKAKPKMAFGGINPVMGMDQYGLDFAGMGRMGQMKKASDMVMARMGMGTGTNSGIAPIAAKGIPAIMMKGISSIAGKTDASINVNPQIDTSGIKTQDIDAGSHNPSVSSRLAGMLGSAGSVGGGLLDNADIIANGFINNAARKRTVPEMGMQSRIDPVEVRADSQINDINTSVRDSQRSLEFAGGQNSSAAKLQALASGMDAKSRTMESVNNTNAQFKSQANMMNSDIEGRNLSSAFQNKMLKYQISDDLDGRTSKNIATAVERRKVGKLDKAKEKLTRRQQLIQLAGSDPRAVEYLFSQLGDKGFADKLDSFGK